MNSFVDSVFDTASTQNKIKYKIIHEDNTEEIVQLEIYTPVTVQGTALNKVYFDSIEDDVNSRLLIADKASNDEAIAGTNTDKYLVPSTMQAKFNKLSNYKSGSVSGGDTATTTTIFQPSDIGSATTGTVTIDGYFYANGTGSLPQYVVVNGTSIIGMYQYFLGSGDLTRDRINNVSSFSMVAERCSGTPRNAPFKIIINLNRQTILIKTTVYVGSNTQELGICEAFMRYSSLTNVRLQCRSGSTNKNASAYYSISYSR